jgi:hypothetical protein
MFEFPEWIGVVRTKRSDIALVFFKTYASDQAKVSTRLHAPHHRTNPANTALCTTQDNSSNLYDKYRIFAKLSAERSIKPVDSTIVTCMMTNNKGTHLVTHKQQPA